MSHFTVLVVTEDGTDQEIQAALAPYHEFECTGVDDEYVQSIDRTAEVREEYENSAQAYLRHRTTGEEVSAYDDRFYVEANGRSQRKDGLEKLWEEFKKPTSEMKTFREYITEWEGTTAVETSLDPEINDKNKWGYIVVDEDGEVSNYIVRTNPDAKWDWWVVGGRWEGLFLSTSGDRLNTIKKADLDIEKMDADAVSEAREIWRLVNDEAIQGESFRPFEELRDELGVEAAREAYWAQPVLVRFKELVGKHRDKFGFLADIKPFTVPEDDYVEDQRLGSFGTFAVLMDGKWAERGDMGWWGCVSDEKDDWNRQFRDIFNSIPDDAYLAVVDCHI